MLGHGSWAVFGRVVLPLARPALAMGLSLTLLETLNDIGASEFLGVHTLTVSIYTTWITRSDLASSAQIALSMLLLVLLCIGLEQHAAHGCGLPACGGSTACSPGACAGLQPGRPCCWCPYRWCWDL